MKFSSEITILNEAIKQAEKPLKRDFGEILSLQSSPKGTKLFSQKSYERVQLILEDNLATLNKNYKIYHYDNLHHDDEDYRWIIYPIDGFNNFAHAIPFFCIAVLLEKKIDDNKYQSEIAFVSAPTIGEIYFVQRNQGAWCENFYNSSKGKLRMRVSSRKYIDDAIICSNLNNGKHYSYGSTLLETIFLAAGRIDICLYKANLDQAFHSIAKIFVQEAGGFFSINNDKIILSNANLQNQF